MPVAMASANSFSSLPENGTLTREPETGVKRIRACMTCRNMKIKCVSVPGSKDCETCLRLSRPCQDPGPPKARMKTSQKFSELESRIDALTSALEIERRRNQHSPNQTRGEALQSTTPDSNGREDDFLSHAERRIQPERVTNDVGMDVAMYGDVVNQRLVDASTASLLFDHWNLHMRPLMPVIEISSEEDVSAIRMKKPILFLTIMTVASASIRPSLVPPLLTRLNNTLAQDVFIQGAKSLDLLQSMILFSQYYIQPPHIRSFALPQHVYSAVVMSHDLGLSTGPKLNGRDKASAKEIHRTLLAVYLGASCSTTLLRRHQPLLFTSSHRDCMEALMRDSDRRNDDQWLCNLVALQEIFDEASKTLNAPYQATEEPFDDFRTQHVLGIFRQRLADWKQSASGNIEPQLKSIAASVADLYIHQVAIRIYSRQMVSWLQSVKKSKTTLTRPALTVTHIDALLHCLKTGAGIFNTYLSLGDALARSLPNIFLIWNLATAVCLIRLGHFTNDLSRYRTSHGDIYDVPSPLDLVEGMIQKLARLSQHGFFPQSRPFLNAFQKLKSWYQQKKIVCLNSNNGSCDDGSGGAIHDVLGTQTPPASPPATVSDFPTPAQIQTNEQARFGTEGDVSIGMPIIQNDWDASLQALGETRTLADATVANAALDPTFSSGYFDTGLGNFEFGFGDIRDMDNFMMQTGEGDGGLWSLL
ncbi:uncharacterized protein F4822DRAFT_407986 [Hypoxylon trugodes]|uniref:uncharacterized protein n=1 Tax=Hypoxylon trugodes TaxID=326681 RepID=UPI0021A1927B|nr:uncharacterized protein F4822DRAFT_407986 [Hypoxylon trugodes]KAI1387923.1 hypothetical protein F4822DRAFT_407986 [Hypoxylon trugodes]